MTNGKIELKGKVAPFIHEIFNNFSRREKCIMSIFVVLLFILLFQDDTILKFTADIRFFPLDSLLVFMTDFGLLYGIIALLVYLLFQKKYRYIMVILLTAISALEASYLLKVIFQTPRPFASEVLATIPLTQASGFSMPSLHTAFCFSLWPYMQKIFPNKKLRALGYIFIILIAFSRLYLGVHYASDLVAGGLIGYFIAKVWLYAEEKYHVIGWFIFQVKDKFELRRQVAHLLTGVMIIFLLKLSLLNTNILFIILIIGGAISVLLRFYKIPYLYDLLRYFERPGDMEYFPGKGSFFLVLGSLLAMMFFKKDIALASISIMAVGDSINTIVGTYFGKIKNPLNPRKHLEGTALAIITSTLAAFFFIDFHQALFGSIVGMAFESVTGRYVSLIIDDNLLIPLIAGAVMTMM